MYNGFVNNLWIHVGHISYTIVWVIKYGNDITNFTKSQEFSLTYACLINDYVVGVEIFTQASQQRQLLTNFSPGLQSAGDVTKHLAILHNFTHLVEEDSVDISTNAANVRNTTSVFMMEMNATLLIRFLTELLL